MPDPRARPDLASLAAGLVVPAFAGSRATIVEVARLAHSLTGTDITVLSVVEDGRYRFAGLEKRVDMPTERDDDMPWDWALCYQVHQGHAPASVRDTREHPQLWQAWLRLKQAIEVDWDILAFLTVDVPLPGGGFHGTLCLHDTVPREWSADHRALLDLLARLVGEEVARERASAELTASLAELANAERRRLDLVDELDHELRAPLGVIDGYAEAMLDGVMPRGDEQLMLVRREAERCRRILEDLHLLTRVEADPASERAEAVELAALCEETRARLGPIADAGGIGLAGEGTPAVVFAVRARLEQVLSNLVRNALRHTPAGGHVTLSTRVVEQDAVVRVCDTGPGVPPVERDRIFERFYRGGSAREAGPGSGLGLAIARRIVEQAGGRLEVLDAPDGGACFELRLPLAVTP